MKHYKTFCLDWLEGKTSPRKHAAIEDHLGICPDCKNYFGEISNLLTTAAGRELPRLEPDPYLPQRINALASARKSLPRIRFVRGAVLTALASAAVGFGIYLGSGLSNSAST